MGKVSRGFTDYLKVYMGKVRTGVKGAVTFSQIFLLL
jgi:hypothetical protein